MQHGGEVVHHLLISEKPFGAFGGQLETPKQPRCKDR